MNQMPRTRALRCAAVVLTLVGSGCAQIGVSPAPPVGGAKPVPIVQNCGVISTGTPSRFVCDGKVYTSYQLAKLREDEARKYAAGK